MRYLNPFYWWGVAVYWFVEVTDWIGNTVARGREETAERRERHR